MNLDIDLEMDLDNELPGMDYGNKKYSSVYPVIGDPSQGTML